MIEQQSKFKVCATCRWPDQCPSWGCGHDVTSSLRQTAVEILASDSEADDDDD